MTGAVFRLIAASELLAMGAVRAYFGAPRGPSAPAADPPSRAEPGWLTGTLASLAVVHFGAIVTYLADPALLLWSAFDPGAWLRWLGIALSFLGVSGEIWTAVSLGASYSPLLQVPGAHALVTAGPYRWIRHPLYAFWIPVMLGWGLAAGNGLVVLSGSVLILVLRIVRVPREEAMLESAFGESYRLYAARAGGFLPRLGPAARQ